MKRRLISLLIQLIVLSGCLQISSFAASAADHCTNPVGKLVSVQGQAQIRRAEQNSWLPARLDARFCVGDMLRIGTGGRAVVALANESVLRIDQNTTLNFGAPDQGFSLLNLIEGVLHIFSHRPRSLQVTTPYVNGAVEGTEFLVRSDGQKSEIIVFEGMVVASNEFGRVELGSGTSATAQKGAAPVFTAVVSPRDAVQWTLYYPVVFDSAGVDGQQVKLLSDASDYLSVGRVEEAGELLGRVLNQSSNNGEALALLSIIEVVQNNNEEALTLAQKALEYAPGSAAAGLALSFAKQATFDIEGALNTLLAAAEAHPNSGQVQARLAELQLSVGQIDAALLSIQKASELDPGIARTQAVLGFVHLIRVEIGQAEAAFSNAIRLDQALPLARLGLGLTFVRKGELARGRGEIEVAAALDPDNALLRSYLGKAYFEEKRDKQASRQYEVAKELDPADPTPWFYDALRKQTVNQPVEALHDLQKSIALNGNRAVYRSSFLLDDDLAARSASLGRIYADLGFQQLALAEGWKSVVVQPGNFSAHRFLADSYRILPRHEIARVSELLQSQLLQPLNINPVQPQLAESNLTTQAGAGPGQASLNEYNPLFLRNRFALQASGVAGSNDILGNELVQSGVWNKFSYSLGQYYYRTDGIRENNDQQKNLYNAYVQGMISPKTSWMSEFRYKKDTFGDLTMLFDPTDYWPNLRQSEEEKSARIGLRHDLKVNSTLLGTAVVGTTDSSGTGLDQGDFSVDIANATESVMAEVQHIYGGGWINLQSGAGYLYSDETDTVSLTFPLESVTEEDASTRHTNLYSYAQLDLSHQVVATLGLSGDLLDSPVKDREQINPKLGVTWQPTSSTLLRGAVFKTVQRRLVYSQTVEPTHVAGFNQFFDDNESTSAWTYGLGLNQCLSDTLFGGVQLFHRDLNIPFIFVGPEGMSEEMEDDWQEDIGSAYLYWAPRSWTSLGIEYYYEQFSHAREAGPQGIKELTTHRFSPQISVFCPLGISARIQANYIDQDGDFVISPFGDTASGGEKFWLVDLALNYRLPKRNGMLSLGVKNLFDEEFRYLDTDPANPRFLPDQQVFVSLTISL